jgi:hypothetical protein
VGIGTSTPQAALDVSSDAKINGLTVGRGNGNVSTNTAVGLQALISNTTSGLNNTAVGYQALTSNTDGDDNSAVGLFALNSNTTGSSNSAVGRNALYTNTIGSSNSAVGYESLYSNNDIQNSALGCQSLYFNNGEQNSGIGYRSLYNNTTGRSNSALGVKSGQSSNGNNNTFLGSYTSGGSFNNSTAIGYNAQVTASNQIMMGTSAETVVFPGIISLNQISYTHTQQLGYQGITPTSSTTISGIAKTISQITLAKGVWNVEGQIVPTVTGISSGANYSISLSTVNNTNDNSIRILAYISNGTYYHHISSIFQALTGPINVYLVASLTSGTCSSCSSILKYTKIG